MPAHFVDQHGQFKLPTHWGEVSTRQFCDLDRLQCATVEARASYFAGRPIQVNGAVADALAFLLVPMEQQALVFPLECDSTPYVLVEEARKLLVEQPLAECLPRVYGYVAAYSHFLSAARIRRAESKDRAGQAHQEAAQRTAEILSAPCTYALPVIAHFCEWLRKMTEGPFAKLSLPDQTEAGQRARAAGADRLNVYGYMPTARHYATAENLTFEEILNRPWTMIGLFMLQDRDQAEIADQLHKNSQHE